MADDQARRRPPRGTVPIIVSPPVGGSPEDMDAFAADLADRLLAQRDMQLRRKAHLEAGVPPVLADYIPLLPERLDEAVGRDWELSGDQIDLSGESPVWFISGSPPEALIGITPAIMVAVPVGVWDGVAHLRFQPGERLLDVAPHVDDLADRLRDAVGRARELRRQTLRPCSYCTRPTPPEYTFSAESEATICMACASKHLGVVY